MEALLTNPRLQPPNRSLIGRHGSRTRLQTPCLVLDLDLLEQNIDRAQSLVTRHGTRLRSHAKTHKCAAITRRQLAAGACGICVATVGEAEALAAAGLDDIHITSTFAAPKIDRVLALRRAGKTIRVTVDNPEVVAALTARLSGMGLSLSVLIDLDMGRHRSGATKPADVLALADLMHGSPLCLVGLQAYAGHLSHEIDYSKRLEGSSRVEQLVAGAVATLRGHGHACDIVSGGSTGTLLQDLELGTFTELQCGSYAVMDVEYRDVDLDGHKTVHFREALTVRTSVISTPVSGLTTCDAGHKQFAAKRADPTPVGLAGSSYRPVSDEHGQLILDPAHPPLRVGDAFECVVPHCDPTVALYDWIHVVRGGDLVDIWSVDARGV